ncbi:uncharacterized protein TERG_12036 [Trichophyton rubrum CBS 118892]|uniref:Uncharacterized protein n=1 Tax=Trichophyton rubrum (strain ATCC MYA-4607 / CBS 118892) TaxID=559305 RepID=A0A080WMD3_TRIRC|nr:uncharacterized protein TERG_12036 [Trichophyton rubrum CBS 118892]KFL61295.1 hypothetical protein TERG_12036 [Trichophyton rubrum CBS 118892]
MRWNEPVNDCSANGLLDERLRHPHKRSLAVTESGLPFMPMFTAPAPSSWPEKQIRQRENNEYSPRHSGRGRASLEPHVHACQVVTWLGQLGGLAAINLRRNAISQRLPRDIGPTLRLVISNCSETGAERHSGIFSARSSSALPGPSKVSILQETWDVQHDLLTPRRRHFVSLSGFLGGYRLLLLILGRDSRGGQQTRISGWIEMLCDLRNVLVFRDVPSSVIFVRFSWTITMSAEPHGNQAYSEF